MTPTPSGASSPVTVLGIDLGTSSVKAVVTDTDGRLISQAAAEYPVFATEPGWAETDPQHWWSAVAAAVHQAVAQSSTQPTAIGLSGQMHGLVMTGFDGAALLPALLWADGRAAPHLAAYAGLGPEALKRLANPLTPGMTGPLLLWVAEQEPQIYKQAHWALQAKDWLRYQLTGQAFAEPSDASATLLYDVPGDRWDTATMSELDLRSELFPTLLPASTSLAGQLTASAAAHLGLTAASRSPQVPQTPLPPSSAAGSASPVTCSSRSAPARKWSRPA